MTGKFIALEGIEGVGKSTNLSFIQSWLLANGIDVLATREPGGTRLGEALRAILLSEETGDICPEAELLAVFAARVEHIKKVIAPALEMGRWVLSDRFTDATFAYQGGGRGLSIQKIEVIEDWVQGSWRPDLTILLDACVETSLSRLQQRKDSDRFERESPAFFTRVRQAYLDRAKCAPQRYQVVDAGQSLENVQKQIVAVLERLVTDHQGG